MFPHRNLDWKVQWFFHCHSVTSFTLHWIRSYTHTHTRPRLYANTDPCLPLNPIAVICVLLLSFHSSSTSTGSPEASCRKHKHQASPSAWVRPYVAPQPAAAYRHLCFYSWWCFHMDTQRTDSDPDAMWTKQLNSVSAFGLLTFSQPEISRLHHTNLRSEKNVREINASICVLCRVEKKKEITCPSSGFLLFSFPILTGNRQKVEKQDCDEFRNILLTNILNL